MSREERGIASDGDLEAMLLALARRKMPPAFPGSDPAAGDDLTDEAREAAWRRREASPPASGRISDSSVPAVPGAGRVVALLGAKGGAGTTFLAVNLAAVAVAEGLRVLLVDLASGDAAAYLDLEGDPLPRGVGDLPALAGGDDPGPLVKRYGGSSLEFLPAPPGSSGRACAAGIEALVAMVRDRYDLVFIDAGSRPDAAMCRAVRSVASRTLVVTTPDAGGLRGAGLLISRLTEAGLGGGDGVALILNRFEPGATVAAGDFHRFLGYAPSAIIPEDRRRVDESLMAGRCLVLAHPEAASAKAIRHTAGLLLPWVATGSGGPGDRGRWERLRSRLNRKHLKASLARYAASLTNLPVGRSEK